MSGLTPGDAPRRRGGGNALFILVFAPVYGLLACTIGAVHLEFFVVVRRLIIFCSCTVLSFFVAMVDFAIASDGAPRATIDRAAQSLTEDIIVRRDTPSGFPVPRFVELAHKPTNCRVGPSRRHPPKFIFQHRHVPLLVIAETRDNWRQVRDAAGDECWVHASTIRGPEHVLILSAVTLRAGPRENAREGGVLEAGVIARRRRVKNGWALISAGGAKGWAPVSSIWGVNAETAQ